MKGSRAAVEVLKDEGVRVVFGHPGGAILPFYDDLYDSGIRHVLVRHEQNAAHMADGYARARGETGVCVATSGPGATNLVTGVATAYMDSSPVLALTGQVATTSMGSDAFQEVDAFSILMPVVKHNWRLETPEEVPRVLREAFRASTAGRCGPVHVDLPLDVQRGEVDEAEVRRPGLPPAERPLDLSRLPEALKIIEGAEAPCVLLGGGARWAAAAEDVMRLAEAIQAPVVTTLMGKGAVPEDHPLCLGPVGMHGKMVATHVLNNCDTVIALGTRFSDRSTGKASEFGRSQRIVHADVDRSEMGKNISGVVGLLGDARTVARALSRGLAERAPRKRSAWLDRVGMLKRECACDFDVGGEPIKPQKVVKELNRALPDDAILTTGVGRHQMWAEHFFEARAKRTFMTSGGLGTMGFGLPAAMGAKVACPDRFVMDLDGDGSFQMTLKELATARDEGIDVAVLVMNDSALGMVLQWQRMFYGQRFSAVNFGRFPDFVKLAEAFGCEGARVDKASELKDALVAAQRAGGPFVLDVPIDPDEDILPFMPPSGGVKNVVLGPRCIWKGGGRLEDGIAAPA
jgi:acetolactate synthase-1/2/3 large subunit